MQNRKEYPENWVDTIRPSILKRDKYKCRHCFVSNRQWLAKNKVGQIVHIDSDEIKDYKVNEWKVWKVYLQVAHLDHNTKNNSPGNLLSLCPSCHLKYDRRDNLLRKIAKLLR